MNRSIPESVSANQQNKEQCKKFLAGNRSCFYRGFWNNAPFKNASREVLDKAEGKPKSDKK